MRNGLVLISALLFAVVVSVLGTAQQTSSCTIFVQPGESVEAAIKTAPAGAVICLGAGEWQERVTIDKPITLVGEGIGATTIHMPDDRGPAIHVRTPGGLSDSVVIEGISVIGGAGESGDPGMLADGAGEVRVTECEFSMRGGSAILIAGMCGATIENCILLGDSDYTGIALTTLANADVVNCIIWRFGVGIGLTDTSYAAVTGCAVSHCGWGIVMDDYAVGAYMTVTRCLISDNDTYGLALSGNGAEVASCTVAGNGDSGIVIGSVARALISGNTIADNGGYGVALGESPCVDMASTSHFAGRVVGAANIIPGAEGPDGNKLGSVCPPALAFLTAAQGGELLRQQSP